MNRLSLSVFVLIATILTGRAEAPAGYYDTCEGKSGKSLLQSLYSVIGNHTAVSYDGLWEVYKTSDVRDDGTVWDIYSTKHWVVGQQHCGNYSKVGDCINKEHSFPKSWFGGKVMPMYSDAYHLYPTDGKVNGQRSSNPYGECANGTSLGTNNGVTALGKSGASTFSGYSGTVFEPDDEYKGDLARTYFYMASCYNDRVSSWSSPMLDGNNYPVFKTWAINLLLKWHRQDPVSPKELKRNEAVSAHQHNRNPFIDHPELAEYIWGNMQGKAWTPGGETAAVISRPVNGSTIELGAVGPGIERSVYVPVKSSGLKQDLTITVTGTGFSVNKTSLTASQANEGGTGFTVSFIGTALGNATGSLTLKSGDNVVTAALSALVTNDFITAPATMVTETSFMANWYNVSGDGVEYKFNLYLNDQMVDGYPVTVAAEDEGYYVSGLEPGGHYSYTVSNMSGTKVSNTTYVTTATPIPSIQVLYDGELTLDAIVDEPSLPVELLLDIDNVEDEIIVTVESPFQVSTDKATWGFSVSLGDGEDRFYLRLNASSPGTYTTEITVTAGDYENDDAEATGVVKVEQGDFFEDFEEPLPGGKGGSYDGGSYTGTACTWKTNDAGVFSDDKNLTYEGIGVCRFGKTTGSWISTSTSLDSGIGTVTFMAKPWSAADGNAKMTVQYSTDGLNWTDAGSMDITGTSYAEYKAVVNKPGKLYLRLQQAAGKRILLDNVKATSCSASGIVATYDYHSWDAYCCGGSLVVENKREGAVFTIFGMDGIERHDGTLPVGTTVMSLTPGLYIVVSDDFARRVLVK